MTHDVTPGIRLTPARSGKVSVSFAQLLQKYGASPRLLRRVQEVVEDRVLPLSESETMLTASEVVPGKFAGRPADVDQIVANAATGSHQTVRSVQGLSGVGKAATVWHAMKQGEAAATPSKEDEALVARATYEAYADGVSRAHWDVIESDMSSLPSAGRSPLVRRRPGAALPLEALSSRQARLANVRSKLELYRELLGKRTPTSNWEPLPEIESLRSSPSHPEGALSTPVVETYVRLAVELEAALGPEHPETVEARRKLNEWLARVASGTGRSST